MKKTILRFSFQLGKVAILPLMLLGLFVFTASTVSAQSYKSPEEASISVKQALEELMPQLSTNPTTPDLMQKATNARAFRFFLSSMNEFGSVEEAYQAVVQNLETKLGANATLNTKATKGNADFKDNAAEALFDLITN